jgi:hypothetical protein
MVNAPAFFSEFFLKILVDQENFIAFGFQNLVLIFMVPSGPNTTITGAIFEIDMIKVSNEFFQISHLLMPP